MTRFKLSALLCAVALLVASCQCVVTCAADERERTQAASTQTLPCHDHPLKDDAKAPACAHSVIVAEERVAAVSSSVGATAPLGTWIPVEPIRFVALVLREVAVLKITSPPESSSAFQRSTVLRI
jgi:hypothetical protein